LSSDSTAPLNVGVVGIGWAGQQHLAAYKNNPDVRVAALAGQEPEMLAQLEAEFSIPATFQNWEDMLASADLDAVSIAVPTFLHEPIAVAALKQGIHVLSEKPIARNTAEGQRMVDAARKAGRVLDVAFNHRRRGDIKALGGIIDGGELGRPYYAKAAWLRRRGIPTLGSWFTNPELAGGGPLIDIGVHVLDYALHLLGEPGVISVSASTFSELGPRGLGGGMRYNASGTSHKYEVEDFSSAFLRLDNGATLVIEAGWASYRAAEDEINFTVLGTEGGAELRVVGNPSPEIGEIRVFKDQDEDVADYELAANPGGAHQEVVDDFVRIVLAGEEEWAKHDGSIALNRARIIDACYESARDQKEVRLA